MQNEKELIRRRGILFACFLGYESRLLLPVFAAWVLVLLLLYIPHYLPNYSFQETSLVANKNA